MEAIYAFLEEINEMAYIADTQTYELLFMNRRLREKLGCASSDAYKGQKCHKVLQDKELPCPFCNNGELQTQTWVTWIHENLVVKQKLIIKDRLFRYKGRDYRIEVAAEASENDVLKISALHSQGETILNGCLQCFFAAQDLEKSIEMLLEYLGETFQSGRSYIFEFCQDGSLNNTYEWCDSGVVSQKEILQHLPIRDVEYWIEAFERHEAVLIYDMEDIRSSNPTTYSLLHPQGVVSLIVVPLYDKENLKGLIGLDNPDKASLPLLEKVLRALSGSVALQLKRRNLYQRFNNMSYRDSLTGAYNRNAMERHRKRSNQWQSFGVVYCDINGLKVTNDTYGHNAGNKLLQECCQLLRDSLRTEWIYRVGGDEFTAFYCNVEEETVKRDMETLRLAVMQSPCQMSVGYAWTDQCPIDTDRILDQADAMMYQEKQAYYEQLQCAVEGSVEKAGAQSGHGPAMDLVSESEKQLQRFLSSTYWDISFLLTQLSDNNCTSYFYFGDMQKDLFYVSENMRQKFGFESNIVKDLIHCWAKRIQDPVLLDRFWADMNNVLEHKQDTHDMRYPIADADGNNVWIRCTGKLKWNEDGTIPLFFAGRITQQDDGFVVDSLTNFPTETALLRHLNDIQKREQQCRVVGISLNNIAQINNNLGRLYGDDLVRGISEKLYQKLSGKATFYRLNGMRCLALIEPEASEETEQIILQMKKIIEEHYQHMGLTLQSPCSFALLNYPRGQESPQDFIESMVSLIKLSRDEPGQLYIDNSKGDIQRIQDTSNMELRLSQDILNEMENFRVVIQPVVCTGNGSPIGGETLLRWSFEGKDISPAVFIPIIERQRMIHLVGRWVFEQAVGVCRRILSYDPKFYLTINASLQQLNDESFVDFIRDTLNKYHLSGEHFVIEMTESCMDEQPEKLIDFVQACANMGIRIALDDFGSGYSSLRVLLQYPSSVIKLDRSLLLEMSDSHEKNNFITSIVYACHQFGKKVCMEGVETERQNELVREAGCDMIQGFYYYRPMEVEQIYQLMANKSVEGETNGEYDNKPFCR